MDLSNLSRVVSHALRHEPWLYELEIDNEGWADASMLLLALRQQSNLWAELKESDLVTMISKSPKQRHEIANGRIRALYGHSLPGRLRKTRASPPAQLFHGTSRAHETGIRINGLLPMGRQYVHLSIDRETAFQVGRRKSAKPVILIVCAEEASKSGVPFYIGNEKVWLADRVPPKFIETLPV